MITTLILDTETTRKEADLEAGIPIEVVELAWQCLETGDNFRSCYQPSRPVQYGALAVHHILPEELAGMPPSSQALTDVPPALYWIGHNIDFDWKALGEPAGPMRVCTLALARAAWPDLDSYSLGALTYFTQGATRETRDKLRNAHSATADVLLCTELFEAICSELALDPRNMQEVYAESEAARVPRKWTFGKFEGSPIGAADRGYAAWFARQCLDRPDYGYYMAALRQAGLVR